MYGNKEGESATQGGESPSQNADDGKIMELHNIKFFTEIAGGLVRQIAIKNAQKQNI